jgi:hypothetical protein
MGAKITFGRAAWLLCACLVLVPRDAAAAAEPSVLAFSLSATDGALPHSQPPENPSGAADDDAGTTEEIAIPGSLLFVLALCAAPRAPALEASIACAPRVACACRSFSAADPFTPRPPPSHVPL